MAQYLTKVLVILGRLDEWTIKRIRRTENTQANALAGVAATLPVMETILLPVHLQAISSIAVTLIFNTK